MSEGNLDGDIVRLVTPRNDLDRWAPVVGPELNRLLNTKGLAGPARDIVVAEALSILAKCAAPEQPRTANTGLIIGYVQSGKTLNFTAVSALARDNDYRMIIVISGITTNLFGQSTDRIESDLQLDRRSDRIWRLFTQFDQQQQVSDAINACLSEWRRDTRTRRRQTVLITIMKNWANLNKLIAALQGCQLGDVPTLIIDDEADQAGLNSRPRANQPSTTHGCLARLRALFPHHSYLSYTATPQAPLLINLIDTLSPDFGVVLTPGQDYIGGRTFFKDRRDLITIIPEDDIPEKEDIPHDPPPSLLEAMRIYFVGCAIGLLKDDEANRSMMVHPSQLRDTHHSYIRWVRTIRRNWLDILSGNPADPDYADLAQEMHAAYAELQGTCAEPPSWDEVLGELEYAVRNTEITELNTRTMNRIPTPDWQGVYSHILVGGNAMDRGYTVRGLTVTYMPRGLGGANADTIQQRARFFGYKASYLGLCRVYLGQAALDAYTEYVDHEENVRDQLATHCRSGRPLKEWKRAFILSPSMRPTRSAVLLHEYRRGNFRDSWWHPKVPYGAPELMNSNQAVFSVADQLGTFRDSADRTTMPASQVHRICDEIPLSRALSDILEPCKMFSQEDSEKFLGLCLQVKEYLDNDDNKNALCTIVQMNCADRYRTLVNGELVNPHQGANPGTNYPGDRQIRSETNLTIQLHRLQLRRTAEEGGTIDDVPVIAVWVPQAMGAPWVAQDPDLED